METLCLDTDVLIDFLRGKNEVVDIIREIEKEFVLATTTVNLFELYFGAYKTGKEKNVEAVNELAERIEVLELNKKSAELAGKIMAELEKKGLEIGIRDTMIAGTLLESGSILYTRNVKHFRRIKEIKLFEFKD